MHSGQIMLNRRSILAGLMASGFVPAARAGQMQFGADQPFDFDRLKARARALAGRAHEPVPRPSPEIVGEIDYATHGQIRYRTEEALFANGPGRFPVTFFHLGRYFQKPVRMHVVAAGRAKEIIYDPALFDMPADSIARRLPRNAGFSGFRLQEARDGQPGPKGEKLDWRGNDWVAFLGASYFRAIGDAWQYGLSARGIAVDPAVAGLPEEFPDFTHFWIETPTDNSGTARIHALLDSPAVCGAFRFAMRREAGVVMDVEADITLRRDVARFCLAPLTSMYWYSETVKDKAVDWRPEVHDSDGLALWTGPGERIWRPLNNPGRTMASSFGDENPRGFGLVQRDRAFENYMDGVHYERRPSLWVEPLGAWGRGAVQLIEIPTDDEIHDNIVAAWVPEAPARAGTRHELKYRLHWRTDVPDFPPLARCVATRLGNGGQPGLPRPRGVRKFMVEFKGPTLEKIPFGVKPEAVLWASRGSFSYIFTEAIPNDVPGHWRAQFDLTVEGNEPVEMRLFLRNGAEILSETWAFQYHPF
jgi:glucans biosynthesis protein